MIDDFINWIMQDLKTRIPIAVAVIGVLGAIIGVFFTIVIWPLLRTGLDKLWDSIVNTILGKGFESRYLDWTISEHRYLPILPTTLLPVTEKQSQELDKLYVELSITDGPQKTKAIRVGDALQSYPWLVILGEPGAGKTTMLRYLTLTFARARRKRSSSSNPANRKKEMGLFHVARKRVKEEYGSKYFPLPVFVYLNRLRDVMGWPSGRSLLDALRDEWKSLDSLRGFPVDFFENKLNRGECIFLFDAFDELGTQDARDAIAKHIGELASSAPSGNRFIVSSRIVGYNGQLILQRKVTSEKLKLSQLFLAV